MWVVVITFPDGSKAVTGVARGWVRGAAIEWAAEHQGGERGWECEAFPIESPASFDNASLLLLRGNTKERKTEMVNKERVRLLVDDLRSGTSKKGQNYLHRIHDDGTETWCCLGRASHLAAEGGCDVRRDITVFSDGDTEMFDGNARTLCEKVVDWFGFDSQNPYLTREDGKQIEAAAWNDAGPKGIYVTADPEPDFGSIADAFERTYLSDDE